MEQHIHNCTGPDATCPCGYKFTVPRFAVSIEVYDNATKKPVLDEAFSCSALSAVLGALHDARSAVLDYDE